MSELNVKSFKDVLGGINVEEYAIVEAEQKALGQAPEVKDLNLIQIAYYYVKGFSEREVAEIMNVTPRTVRTAKMSDEFKVILSTITSEIVSAGRMFLSTAGLKAVKTLIDLLDSPNDKVKLQASTEILNRIGLKAPDKLEIITKGDTISQMDETELMSLIKLGMEEIIPKSK